MGDYQAVLAIDRQYRQIPFEEEGGELVEDFKSQKINIADHDVMKFDWDYYKKSDEKEFLENLRDCDGDTSVLNKLVHELGADEIMNILGAREVTDYE